MRTQEEIKNFEGFCNIIGDEFTGTFMFKIKNENEQVLESLLSDLKTWFHTGKDHYFFQKEGESNKYCIDRKNFEVAINILNWMLEE